MANLLYHEAPVYANFVEIGTSDFDTLCQIQDEEDGTINFSVEPISYYLNRLPNKKNVTKVNYAISNHTGSIDIFYIKDEDCKKLNLPNGLRGCNTIGKPHPGAMRLLQNIGHPELMHKEQVLVVNVNNFLKEYNIIGIKHLKLDTEGHDCVILNELLDHGTVLPDSIVFESNILTPSDTLEKMRTKLVEKGYTIGMVGEDTYAQLKPHMSYIPEQVNLDGIKQKTFVTTLFNVCDRISYEARVHALQDKKDIDGLLERATYLLNLDSPVVFYCDLGYGEKILKLRSKLLHKTVVIEKNLEDYNFNKNNFQQIQEQMYFEACKANYFASRYIALTKITTKDLCCKISQKMC